MAHELRLPVTIVSPADIARIKRDLDTFNDEQHQADLREKSSGKPEVIQAGRVLSDLASINEYDLANADQRVELLKELEKALKLAPTITMSFAVDPSAAFMSKIVEWLRKSVHPQVLVRIGLQPNIAAGCIVRTSSKIYDFSLRSKFAEQRPMLISRLQASTRQAVNLKAPTEEASA